MDKPRNLHEYLPPLAIYVLVISLIFLMKRFMSAPYVVSVSAVLMLSIPFMLKTDMSDLRWDPKGVLTGIAVSIVLLLVYIAVLAGYGLYSGNSLTFGRLSYTFILIQLLLVALPEEVFFRGYLQQKLGNTLKGIVAVSFLFALGHFITLCLGGGHGLSECSQAVLTFFPSLVMGYLYMATGTLWASIIFHFLANIVHISAGFS
ncbi:MAG: CPBP family intramembrane glutamic endopeptidase [Thermodesulfobacteriota bacterium]